MEKGYVRRERQVVDGGGAKRPQQIGCRTAVPNHIDDGEFAGWWAYAKLTSFFTGTRRVANAVFFESLIYLFTLWKVTVDDKEVHYDEGLE